MASPACTYPPNKKKGVLIQPSFSCSSASWRLLFALILQLHTRPQLQYSFVIAHPECNFTCYCMLVPDKGRNLTNIHASLDCVDKDVTLTL